MNRNTNFNYTILGFIVICILLPFVISTIVHFNLITNYSNGSFSLNAFMHTYYTGIYKYRILGRELFLSIYHFVATLAGHGVTLYNISSTTLSRLGSNSEPLVYLTQYINDTGLLILIAIVLFVIFGRPYFSLPQAQRNLSVLCIILIIAISHFVLTPYDDLFYLILSLAMFFTFEEFYNDTPQAFWGTLITLILGAFTIEHSVLIMSFYAAIYCDKYGVRWHKPVYKIITLVIAFFIVYFILRKIYGTTHGMYDVLALTQVNLRFLHITFISILFLIVGSLATAGSPQKLKRILTFLLFSFPYIIAIGCFAYLAEMRVWIPVIFPAICLGLLNKKAQQFPMGDS